VGATTSFILVTELWRSNGAHDWHDALAHYWDLVKDRELERQLEALDLDRLRRMDARGWYVFLREEGPALNRYGSITMRRTGQQPRPNLVCASRAKDERLSSYPATDLTSYPAS
jgi:hypothetical protein